MKKNRGNLTEEEWNLLQELEQMPENEIDTDDIPEVLEIRNPRRGSINRHDVDTVVVSLDQDIVSWWESLPHNEGKLDHWVNEIVLSYSAQEKNRKR